MTREMRDRLPGAQFRVNIPVVVDEGEFGEGLCDEPSCDPPTRVSSTETEDELLEAFGLMSDGLWTYLNRKPELEE